MYNIASKADDAFEQVNRATVENVCELLSHYLIYQVSHFDVEEMVVDFFYWFDKSTKWKTSLDSYCSFCDISYREIIKYVNTRWLSLVRAVDCALQQYEMLKSYFSSESMFHI